MSITKVVNNVPELVQFIMENIHVPEEYIDRITLELITDPVTCNDGLVYDRMTFERIRSSRGKNSFGESIGGVCFPAVHYTNKLHTWYASVGVDFPQTVRNLARGPQSITLSNFTLLASSIPVAIPASIIEKIGKFVVGVVDVSGSMGGLCQTSEGCYTRLELVIYAVILMILSMDDGDELMLITFSDRGEIVINRMVISSNTRTQAIEIVRRIRTQGGTNIASGLQVAYANIRPTDNYSIHLFTDGADTTATRNIRDTFNSFSRGTDSSKLHMYGFSSEADAVTLCKMSPGSPFYFISDYSMLLTAFINGYANVCFPERITLSESDVVVVNASILAIENILKSNLYTDRLAILDSRVALLKSLDQSELVAKLIEDFEPTLDTTIGQLAKAIEDQYIRSWGIRFIYSYLSALKNLVALNYKDRAPGFFVTDDKQDVISRCETLLKQYPIDNYITATPNQTYSSGYGSYASSAPAVSRVSVYDPHGGCFLSDSLIQTIQGMVCISNLLQGDIVLSCVNGVLEETRVFTLIKIPYQGKMYVIDDYVSLTPYHPYKGKNGKISFPIDENQGSFEYSDYVYDIVLENRGLLISGGITYATWGHNCNEGIFKHEFFGNERIVTELNNISSEYQIELPVNCFRRDPESNLVVGFNL